MDPLWVMMDPRATMDFAVSGRDSLCLCISAALPLQATMPARGIVMAFCAMRRNLNIPMHI